MEKLINSVKLIFLFIIFAGCYQSKVQPLKTGLENSKLPAFSILKADSYSYFNSASFESGRRLIVFYFSPTCQYCRTQMREALNNIEYFKGVQLCVLIGGDRQSLNDFNKYFKLDRYQNVTLGIDTGYVLAKRFQIGAVPYTMVFNESKQLMAAYLGRLRGEDFLRIIK